MSDSPTPMARDGWENAFANATDASLPTLYNISSSSSSSRNEDGVAGAAGSSFEGAAANNAAPLLDKSTTTDGGDLEGSGRHVTVVGYLVIAGFLCVLALCLLLLMYKLIGRQRRVLSLGGRLGGGRGRSGNNNNNNGNSSDDGGGDEGYQYPSGRATKQRIQRRYETVEHWIVSKKVQPHDGFCEAAVSNFCHHDKKEKENKEQQQTATTTSEKSDSSTVSSAATTADGVVDSDTDDEVPSSSSMAAVSFPKPQHPPTASPPHDNVRECPICMSELRVGQIVSWSANPDCCHVFHHECIKEWLLRHIDCCLCKNVYLPVDEKRGKAKTEALNELSHRYAAAAATSYYCVQTGLVRIPQTVRCTRSELQQLERRIFDGAVQPADLVDLRGSRTELSTTAHEDPCRIIESGSGGGDQGERCDDSDTDPTVSNNTSFETTLSSLDENEEAEMDIGQEPPAALGDHRYEQYDDVELGASSNCNNNISTSINTSTNEHLGSTNNTDSELLVPAADWLQQQNEADFSDPCVCIQTNDNGGIEVMETTSGAEVEETQIARSRTW